MKNKLWTSGIIMALFAGVMIFSYAGCGGGGASGGSSGTATDRPPVLTSPGNQAVDENQPISFTILAGDPDGNTIIYSMAGTPTGATLITDTGVFNWTPSYIQAGAYPVTFTATANSLSDSEVITITVNNVDRAPTLTSPGNQSIDESQALTFTLAASDPDGDTIFYAMVGTPTGSTLNASSGEFSWSPTYTQSGSYAITFTSTANSLSDSKVITITVTNVDRAPVLTSPGNQSIDESQVLTFTLAASDPDGDSIFYAMVGTPTGSTLNSTSGLFNWTPDYNQAGSYAVTFTAINSLLDSKVITITVTNVDRAPVLTSPGLQAVNENVNLTFPLSAADDDGDTITYSMAGTTTGATLVAGVFDWTPDYTQADVYTVVFTATSNALTDFKTITITVINSNRVPTLEAVNDKNVNEDATLSFVITGTDLDIGDTLTYSAGNLPGGANFYAITRTFSWTPTYEQFGIYPNVAFTVTDTGVLYNERAITITVINVDRPPVLTSPGDKTIDEIQVLTFTLTASDLDGDTIFYAMVGTPTGATLITDTGVFNWTPSYIQAGAYPVTFTATANSLSDSKVITITVNNVDRVPTLTSPGNQSIDESQVLTFTLAASDPDGDTIFYAMVGTPTGSTLNASSGEFSWSPTYTQSGSYAVTFTAINSLLDSKAITITVTNIDRAPVLTSPGLQAVNENVNLTFPLSAADDDGDTITYSMAGTTTGATLVAGVFDWTPDYTQADVYTVVFTATSNALSDSKSITITVNNVNRAPILDTINNQATDEGLLLTFVITGTDPDSDTLVYSAAGLPAGATFVTSTRTFFWTPSFIQSGVYTGTIFTVTDNGVGNLIDSETITITVNAVNVSPSFTKGSNQTVLEDAGVQTVTNWATGISPGPSDESGQTLNFIVSNDNNPLFSAQPAVAANGTLTYTAAANANGSAIVNIQIHDDGGTANGGIDTSTALTFTITVNNVDDPPVLVSPGNQTVDESQVLTFTLSATDADNDAITYTMVSTPTITGAVLVSGTGAFSWTPGDTQSGIYVVTFTATANSLLDSETITITVNNTLFVNSGGGVWSNYRTITITNNSGGALTDYQVLLQPFKDSGNFIGDSITNTGIAGSWSFDEGAGITATDSSDNGNDGTLTNAPTWTSGRFGNALAFDGVDDYVVIPDNNTLDFTTDVSVECWVKFNAIKNCGIVDKGYPDGYILALHSDGKISWGKNGTDEVLSNTTIITNQWYHFIATRNGGVDKIYINSVLDNSAAKVDFSVLSTSLVIGDDTYNIPSGSWRLNGLIDEVRVYNRALSAQEVIIQYQTGAKPIGSWSFDEGTGITATDSSDNGNNGTVANSPDWTTGRYGNALKFEASDQYVTIPHIPAYNTGVITIELWMKGIPSGTYSKLIGKGPDPTEMFGLYLRDTGEYKVERYLNGLAGSLSVGVMVGDNVWHHLVYTYDGITERCYVDGIQRISNPIVGSLTGNSEQISIGKEVSGSTNQYPFNGIIDEVKIYPNALSAEEVAIRYGSGLAGSWHFSEITGTAAADMSGNNNNCTLNNGVAITATGRFGNALAFDGLDDYVSIPDSDYWNLTSSNGTIEMWVKADTLSGANAHGLITQVNNDQNWALYVYNDGIIGVGRAGVNEIVSSSGIITTGQWYHIVTTKSGGTTTIYVNGINVASNTTAVWTDTANVLRIGGHRHLDIDYYFSGLMDEVRIYNRALAASEIVLRYNSNAPRYQHDFADIRFSVNSSPSTELSYWSETDTKFWVKIPSLPAGETAIRMHYGNASATAVSSGADTFVWFDDFNRDNNDTIGVGYTEDNVQCNWNILNNMLRWTDSVPNNGYTGDSVLNIATEAISSHKIRFKRYFTRANAIGDDHGAIGMLRGIDRIAAFWYEFHRWNFGANQYDLVTRYTGYPYNGGTQYGTTIAGSISTVADTWQNIEAIYYNQQIKVKIGETLYSFADDLDVAFDKSLSLYSILIDGDGAGDLVVDIDDLIISKYSEIAPTGSVSGTEQ